MVETRCEFCGEIKETEGTSLVGMYCIEGHKINIGQSREAIRAIKARKDGYDNPPR